MSCNADDESYCNQNGGQWHTSTAGDGTEECWCDNFCTSWEGECADPDGAQFITAYPECKVRCPCEEAYARCPNDYDAVNCGCIVPCTEDMQAYCEYGGGTWLEDLTVDPPVCSCATQCSYQEIQDCINQGGTLSKYPNCVCDRSSSNSSSSSQSSSSSSSSPCDGYECYNGAKCIVENGKAKCDCENTGYYPKKKCKQNGGWYGGARCDTALGCDDLARGDTPPDEDDPYQDGWLGKGPYIRV